MKIRCAIFDFDGTLFDSMYVWNTAGERYIRSLGKEPKPSLRESLRALSSSQAAHYLKEEYELDLSVEEIMTASTGRLSKRISTTFSLSRTSNVF